MTRAWLAALVALAWSAQTARSEIFECVEEDGRVRFANAAHDCGHARPHALTGRVESIPAAAVDDPQVETGEPRGAARGIPGSRLEQLLLAERDVRTGWSVIEEAPVEPIDDPDLIEWGVAAQRARHYTRSTDRGAQVCSIEIWAFEDEAHARAAHEGFRYPNWRIERSGLLLVMVRALTRGNGGSGDRTLHPDCLELGDRVRARAAQVARD